MPKTLEQIKAEEEAKKQAQANGDDPSATDPPKKRRRRRKAPPSIPAEETQGLIDVIFSVIAARAGEHWKLTPEESNAGAVALNAVMVKHVPTVTKYQEELALLTWTFAVVIPRLDLAKLLAPKEDDKVVELETKKKKAAKK